MDDRKEPIVLLVAEDDEDDFMLVREALEDGRLVNRTEWVKDGEELMDYLRRRGQYAEQRLAPRPGVILLDLNMPRKDGREALEEIKKDPSLRSIPVIVLTTSGTEEDVLRSYDLGVNSFIKKPVRFEDFYEAVRTLGMYWFQIVRLPGSPEGA
jgi:two-component system response regulator